MFRLAEDGSVSLEVKANFESKASSEAVSRLYHLQAEIEKRDQVIGELTLANRLLKKDLRMI